MAHIRVQTVGAEQLTLLRILFDTNRQTRHCWCAAFCTTRWQFTRGWYGGGNRRRVTAIANADPDPLGVLATIDGNPAGWCACGPRTRYTHGSDPRCHILAARDSHDSRPVWHIACLYVSPDHRTQSIIRPLLDGAISTARKHGATAIEAWPLPRGYRDRAQTHLGREGTFTRLGFDRLEQPAPDCVLMRLNLA